MKLHLTTENGKPVILLSDDTGNNRIRFEVAPNSDKYLISINGSILGYMNKSMAISFQHSISLMIANMK